MVTKFLRYPGGKCKAVTLSYDDGVEEDIKLIEIMKKHGLKGTFNLNSGLFGPEDRIYKGKWHRRISKSEALEVYTPDVCEVACHGVTHEFCEYCDSASFALEVLEDRKNLETLFQKQIHGMAYANGSYNDTVVDVCKNAGIYYARTVIATRKFNFPTDWLRLPTTCHHRDPELDRLTDEFLAMDATNYGPKLFYLWGHTYEFADANNWHVIEKFAEKMGGRDDIWYATNMELYYTWLDYQRLECSADGSIIHNPSVRSVWFADRQKNIYEVKPGETVVIK